MCRPLTRLAQDEEHAAGGGGGLGHSAPMITRTHLAFRIDRWTDHGIVEHVAGATDFQVAMATYYAARKRWPKTAMTLRQGAHVIEDNRRSRIATLFSFPWSDKSCERRAVAPSGAARGAGWARPGREEPAMMTEVIAILVSVGLVLVTIVGAVLVWRTKQQARQAATLGQTEAVNYLREAQSVLENERAVTPQAVVSLRKAKNLAHGVFSNRTISDLNSALQTAEGASQRQRLHQVRDSKAIEASRNLEKDLQAIINQMKREAHGRRPNRLSG